MNAKQRGFSYIELLVVVAIAGLVVTGIRITGTSDDQLREEAARIIALQNELADSAIFGGTPHIMAFKDNQYSFQAKQGDTWQLLQKKPFKTRPVTEQLWLAEPGNCDQKPDKRTAPELRVLLLPDGQRSPFVIDVCDGESIVRITGGHTSATMEVL